MFLLQASAAGMVAAIAGRLDAKVDDQSLDALISRMTLEEKAGQLHLEGALSPRLGESDFAKQNPYLPPTTEEQAHQAYEAQLGRIRAGGIGMLSTPMDLDSIRVAQRVAVQESRLGIPLMIGADLVHGFRTVFPVPVAEAASFEPDLA